MVVTCRDTGAPEPVWHATALRCGSWGVGAMQEEGGVVLVARCRDDGGAGAAGPCDALLDAGATGDAAWTFDGVCTVTAAPCFRDVPLAQ
jgi:hypothetical protein